LRPIAADIGHVMRDDQMVLGIDGDLHIVTDNVSALTAGRHRAGIGIGQGDLFVGRGLNLLANLHEGLHLPLQALDLLLKADCLGLGHIAVLPVGTVQDRQVARDAGLQLRRPRLQSAMSALRRLAKFDCLGRILRAGALEASFRNGGSWRNPSIPGSIRNARSGSI
jgi:hypothetical protein